MSSNIDVNPMQRLLVCNLKYLQIKHYNQEDQISQSETKDQSCHLVFEFMSNQIFENQNLHWFALKNQNYFDDKILQ